MKKKILSVVLGASLGFGIAAIFAQEPPPDVPKTEKSRKSDSKKNPKSGEKAPEKAKPKKK